MVHPARLRTTTKLSDRIGIGGPIQLIFTTGNLSNTRGWENRGHVGIMSHEVINHLQEQLTSGPRTKRTAHPGEKVVMSVKSNTVIPTCIVEIQAP